MKKGQKEFRIRSEFIYFTIPVLLYFAYSFNLFSSLQFLFQKTTSLSLIPLWAGTIFLLARSKIADYQLSRQQKEKILFYSIFITFVVIYFSTFSLKVPIISAATCTSDYQCPGCECCIGGNCGGGTSCTAWCPSGQYCSGGSTCVSSCISCGMSSPTISPSQPTVGSSFTVICPTSSCGTGKNQCAGIQTYIDSTSNPCTWVGWTSTAATYSCTVNTVGDHTAYCQQSSGNNCYNSDGSYIGTSCDEGTFSSSFTAVAACDGTISVSNSQSSVPANEQNTFTVTASNTGTKSLTVDIQDEIWEANCNTGERLSFVDQKKWSDVSLTAGSSTTNTWSKSNWVNGKCYSHTTFFCSKPLDSSNQCFKDTSVNPEECWSTANAGNIDFEYNVQQFTATAPTDTTPPSVSTPIFKYSAATDYVSSTYADYYPYVESAVSDSGSGINTGTCEVCASTSSPCNSWSSASYGSEKCYALIGTYSDGNTVYVNFRVKDNVGNLGTSSESSRIIDTNGPTSSVSLPATETTSTTWKVSWSLSDSKSGVNSYEIQRKVGTGSYTSWFTGTDTQNNWGTSKSFSADDSGTAGETICYKVRGKDKVLNQGSSWSTEQCITVKSGDTTLPSVGQISPQAATVNIETSFKASVSDDAGVKSCEFVIEKTATVSMTLSTSPCTSCEASASYKFTSTGTYEAYAYCSDTSNNKNYNPTTITVSEQSACVYKYFKDGGSYDCTYDLRSPRISTTEPGNGQECTVGASPTQGGTSPQQYTCYKSDCVQGKIGSCPTTGSGCDGSSCVVKNANYNIWDCINPLVGFNCCASQNTYTGAWSASTSECVLCDTTFPVKKKVYGDASSIYADKGGINLQQYKCERGCTLGLTNPIVPSDLDEDIASVCQIKIVKLNGQSCSGTVPIHQGDSITLTYELSDTATSDLSLDAYELQGIYKDNTLISGMCYTSEYSVGSGMQVCRWGTKSRTITAPTTLGTYTYTVKCRGGIDTQLSASTACTSADSITAGWDNTASCTMKSVECTSDSHCAGKLVGGLKTFCQTNPQLPDPWTCQAGAAGCKFNSDCGPGFCCHKVIGGTNTCKSLKTVENPYICK